jgi:protein ImuA
LFVAPRNPADRLWAIDLALRSPAVSVVVADGGGFDMAATRRIQLVAKNHAVQAFLVRPPWEQAQLSAAHTRWLVQNATAGERKMENGNPMWTIELLRCKGVHWGTAANVWRLEWNRAECTLDLSTPVADPAGTAQTASAITKHSERHSRQIA